MLQRIHRRMQPQGILFRRTTGLAIVVSLTLLAGGARPSQAEDEPIVAVFELGAIQEAPAGEQLFGSTDGESLKDLVSRLKRVRDDQRVKGVVLLLDGASLGLAQMEEVRRALDQIKMAGKEIHAHAGSFATGGYFLLSSASRLSVVPTGDVFLTGLYGESLHVRGLLDHLGVTPDYFTCGEYKSAAEMFTRKDASPQAAENLNWLLDGTFHSMVERIAESRRVTPDKVKEWIDRGIYSAESAKEAGIVDAVEHRQDFVAGLKAKYGEKVRFDKRYGRTKRQEVDLSSPFGLFQFYADLLGGGKRAKSTKDAIAIVYVDGQIVPGKGGPGGFPFGLTGGMAHGDEIAAALDKVAEDPSIKAVVLRVDSPGGSATASEVILNATKRVKAKKPLVVSMGNVAGSGGYYVACGSDTIFANETTVTGSIGVVMGKFATTPMWDKLGVNFQAFKRGKNAGALESGQPFSDEERAQLKLWMDEIYSVFKLHVVRIRGNRLKKEIEQLAGGRVYTGRQALELGLIDKIGGLDDAIRFVAEQAKIDNYELRVAPEPKGFFELLTGENKDDPATLSLSGSPAVGSNLLGLRLASRATLLDQAMPLLGELEPRRARSIQSALRQVELLQKERLILTMPMFRIGEK